jgi:hypothetical protein
MEFFQPNWVDHTAGPVTDDERAEGPPSMPESLS